MLERALISPVKWSVLGILSLLLLIPACEYDNVLGTVGCSNDTDCGSGGVCLDGYCIEEIIPADPLERITLTPAVATVDIGETVIFSAALLDENGVEIADRRPTWASSNSAVASIDGEGIVTALTPGTVLIRASSGRLSAAAALTVSAELVPIDHLDRIEVTPSVATITLGSTALFSAVLLDANGQVLTDRTPTWESSHPEVATVDAEGEVRALTAGTTVIRVSSGQVSAAAAVTVTPEEIFVDSVAITPTESTVAERASVQLEAVALDGAGQVLEDRIFLWSTGDSDIARVDSTGLVTGVAPGTVTITASAEGVDAQATITVTERGPASVQLIPQGATLAVDETLEIMAIVRDDEGMEIERDVTWSSSDETIATVDENGVVTAIGGGTATITVASRGVEQTFVVTVISKSVTSVVVTPLSITLEVGAGQSLMALAFAGQTELAGTPVDSWESSDGAVATVSASGEVNAIAPGVAVISATIDGTIGGAFVQVVPRAVTSVTVNPIAATIREGEFVDLSAQALADTDALAGRIALWSSSNVARATVDSNGRVQALTQGTATITANIEGEEGSSTITITPRAVDSVDVSPMAASLEIGDEIQLAAVVRADDGRALGAESVTWSTTSSAVSVSATGLVTALAVGTGEVIARSDSDNAIVGTATITVSLRAVSSVTVSPSTLSLEAGGPTATLNALVTAGSDVVTDRDVVWTSSNPNVATVSNTGVVTPLAEGTALITATSAEHSGSAAVTVSALPIGSEVATIEIELAQGSVAETLQGVWAEPSMMFTLAAIVRDTNGHVMSPEDVTWSVNEPTIATVDPATGEVVTLLTGVAIITATSVNTPSISATFEVEVTFAFNHVAVGRASLCGLSTMDNLYCWGVNDMAQFGDGTLTSASSPRLVAENTGFTNVVLGVSHGCGLALDQAHCWGINDRGQLGDGTNLDSRYPVPVAGAHAFAELTLGEAHTCGRTVAGTVLCWGANESGQLGNDSIVDHNEPTPVDGGLVFEAIGAGQAHTCALANDKKVYCWGDNGSLQLDPDAATTLSLVPVTISGGGDFVSLSVGGQHACAIEDEAVEAETYCWGNNSEGQLGDASIVSTGAPVPVATLQRFNSLAAGEAHHCGLNSAGEAYCWGRNTSGQVGVAVSAEETTPVAVSGELTFGRIAAGGDTTCGIDMDRRIHCWGRGDGGQLGDGASSNSHTPVPLGLP